MEEAVNDVFKLVKSEGNLIFNFENAVEKTALSEANRISQYKDMISPTPAAGPLMAAMIGFGTDGK